MRILQIIHSADPAGGGPIEAVRQLSLVHQNEGHVVEVLCLDPPESNWVVSSRLPIHALGPSSRGYGYTPRLVAWLRARHQNYDMVVVNGIWQFSSFGVWWALRESGTPFTVFIHGMLDPWFKRRYPGKHFKKWIYWLLAEHRVLRDAEAVLFTCEEERLLARRCFPFYRCKEMVVNFGTADPGGCAASQREVFFDRFPQLRGKRIVLFLGRIHEKKGCRELIEAWHAVSSGLGRVHPEMRLVMAGPTENEFAAGLGKLQIQLGLADEIIWTGMLSGDSKWGAFHAAEAFILPSHQENFGIAVAEALACSVPVLISNKVNIWREIAQDGAGFVGPDDVAGTQCLLERWLALDAGERQRFQRAARACFVSRFEITNAGQHLLQIFESIRNRMRMFADDQSPAAKGQPLVKDSGL